jgi:hypothetical protein
MAYWICFEGHSSLILAGFALNQFIINHYLPYIHQMCSSLIESRECLEYDDHPTNSTKPTGAEAVTLLDSEWTDDPSSWL